MNRSVFHGCGLAHSGVSVRVVRDPWQRHLGKMPQSAGRLADFEERDPDSIYDVLADGTYRGRRVAKLYGAGRLSRVAAATVLTGRRRWKT